MKIRDLRHRFEGFPRHVRAWPPIWVPGGWVPIDAFGEDGVLESVSVRRQSTLAADAAQGPRAYGRTLSWDRPPSLTAVEEALRAHLGKAIRDIGELDV